MTDTHTLLDRYCTCKTLCVWIPMDVGSFVWSVLPRAFQPYCPSCKIIANEYYEKNEQNALMLTPKVAFQMYIKLAAKDKEVEGLKAQIEKMKCCSNCMHDINKESPKSPCRTCRNRMERPHWEETK